MLEHITASVSALEELWSPFDHGLWCEAMRREDVAFCIAKKWSLSPSEGENIPFDTRYYLAHAARIAWFVENGYQGSVEIDVPIKRSPTWYPVRDGNHRLAAAIIRGDKTIPAVWWGGPQDVLEKIRMPPSCP